MVEMIEEVMEELPMKAILRAVVIYYVIVIIAALIIL